MNRLRDPFAVAQKRHAKVLAESLPPLEARLRAHAISRVAARIAADLGDSKPANAALLATLVRCADSGKGEVERLRSTENQLLQAHQSARSAAEQREVLLRYLDEHSVRSQRPASVVGWIQGRLASGRDRAALRRHLDLEAMQERFAVERADRIDEVEVAYHAFAALAGKIDEREAVRTSQEAGVLALIMMHAEVGCPTPIRRAALLAGFAFLKKIPAAERLGHLGLKAARAILSWARGVGAVRWVQVAAMDITVLLFGAEALSFLAERLRDRSETVARDGQVIRRNALRILGEHPQKLATLAKQRLLRAGVDVDTWCDQADRGKAHRAPLTGDTELQAFDAEAMADDPADRSGISRIALTEIDPLFVALIARDDPSEHVRQELARLLCTLGRRDAYQQVLLQIMSDASPRVRAVALRELIRKATDEKDTVEVAVTAVVHALSADQPPLPARVALDAVRALCTGGYAVLPPETFVDILTEFANRPGTLADLSDEAAAVLRVLEVESRPVADRLRHALLNALANLLEGQSATVDLPRDVDPRDVERALGVAARGDMTVSLRVHAHGPSVITRGEPRRRSLWRIWHELKTPMPDKRKGFDHTLGRAFAGEVVAPPVGMAEVTPTRVPGERVMHPELGGWAPFLPRVDDLLAVSDIANRQLRLVTARGTMTLKGPAGLSERLRAHVRLMLRYEHYAQARQRSLTAAEALEQRRFAEMIGAMGFSMRFGDTEGQVAGKPFALTPHLPRRFLGTALMAEQQATAVALLLLLGWHAVSYQAWGATQSLASAIPSVDVLIDSFVSYFVSPAGNAPTHLSVIAWVIVTFLIARAAWIMRTVEQARHAIPLTVGGWGTRGKSGSERLKAALFHALRYDVVVKTTGCEAMFIHAMRDLPAQEVFIYRPYDKATIWEQREMLHVAQGLNAQVFLWECMALQPLFVDTLCAEWMRDEITTLTNAYPDHEDIQGPTGEDVARVIARFMPTRGRTFTTEEQMLPLLKDAAKKKDTELVAVAPLEADLLPLDLLQRLPYQEHPRNVALILALAEHLGVDREFALVEMADHVILDLGVLKTYPTVEYMGRRLTFSNGMSANERAGFLSNWTRLEFDEHDPDFDPETTTVMVVNNRADRVARSRVFAQILVEDIGVDHVVLINTNLGGMMQFITEGLDLRLREMSVTGEGGKARALERFDEALKKLGVYAREKAFEEELERILRALPMDAARAKAIVKSSEGAAKSGDAQALAAAVERAIQDDKPAEGADDLRADIVEHARGLTRRQALRDKVRDEVERALDAGDDARANEAFRRAYRELFLDRITVLWDPEAKGDKVIDVIARQVPPGKSARIMGSQNIKGTGLDFVYRWLSIDRVRSALDRMKNDPASRREVLSWLMSYSDFGLIDCREALGMLRGVREGGLGEGWSEHASLVEGVIGRLGEMERQKAMGLVARGKASIGSRLLLYVEQLVDHLDSIRRTHWAHRVMDDLFAFRVGHGRAALLLREIVGRQKGGWLKKDVMGWIEARRKAIRRRDKT